MWKKNAFKQHIRYILYFQDIECFHIFKQKTLNKFTWELMHTELKRDTLKKQWTWTSHRSSSHQSLLGSVLVCLLAAASRLQKLHSKLVFYSCSQYNAHCLRAIGKLLHVVTLQFQNQGSQQILTQLKTWRYEGRWTKPMASGTCLVGRWAVLGSSRGSVTLSMVLTGSSCAAGLWKQPRGRGLAQRWGDSWLALLSVPGWYRLYGALWMNMFSSHLILETIWNQWRRVNDGWNKESGHAVL